MNWKVYTSSCEKTRTLNLGFFFVFVSGALFSIFLFSLYNFVISIRKAQISYHTPENHFLQLRDDASLIPMLFRDDALDVGVEKNFLQEREESEVLDGKHLTFLCTHVS